MATELRILDTEAREQRAVEEEAARERIERLKREAEAEVEKLRLEARAREEEVARLRREASSLTRELSHSLETDDLRLELEVEARRLKVRSGHVVRKHDERETASPPAAPPRTTHRYRDHPLLY